MKIKITHKHSVDYNIFKLTEYRNEKQNYRIIPRNDNILRMATRPDKKKAIVPSFQINKNRKTRGA